MKPIDFRLVSKAKATTRFLFLVVALALLASLATVVIAWALSSFVVGVFTEGKTFDEVSGYLLTVLCGAALRAAIHFTQEFAGFYAAGKVKSQLRHQALGVIERDGSALVKKYGSAELSQLLGPSLDSLDIYFSKYLPQLVFTVLVTPGLAALIWFMDPASGLTVLLTLPLIPLFMVMIGLATRDLQSSQLDALERLNGHFLEIVKGVVTLKVFGRTALQQRILAQVSDQYRQRTMRVLRLSFLSGFALELAASLSVALIAVSIGLRLVGGEMPLFIGLFVLIIAPEVYLPLRNVGAQFHAASQGVAVSSRILDLIDDAETLPKVNFELRVNPGLTVITGRSGTGKSLALRELISVDATWMPQQTVLIPGTIWSNVIGPAEPDVSAARRALVRAQLLDMPSDFQVMELDGLSGGQRQRVGLARAFYHLEKTSSSLLLLDEPTSQLDPEVERRVIEQLRTLVHNGVKIVVATHSRQLIEAADTVVNLDD